MQRKTGYNQFPHPEVLSATADPIFFISVIFVFSNVATLTEKKTTQTNCFFTQQLYKTGCYQEVNADNPLACSEGIIQTHAGTRQQR